MRNGRQPLNILVPLLVLAAAVLPGEAQGQGLAGPGENESLAEWTERWLDGPVSLIATPEEREMFASLETTRQRLQFIRLFWERRDTQFRGPRNEFLDEFEDRLAYAEKEFGGGREAGWETVFGQVVMLFGKPDRTRRELGTPQGFSDRPPILWSYDERLPGMEPNEDLLFVFRAGRWKLMPPYPLGETAIPEAARQAERQSNVGPVIPSDYQVAIDQAIADSLVNPVDYDSVRDLVETAIQLPDQQIPFGWTADVQPTGDGDYEVSVELTWRLGSLIFHLVEGEFVTDMVIDVQLVDGDELGGAASERVRVTVPEGEMDARREEVVRRTVTFRAEEGDWDLELLLLDQLLGYRTAYSGTLSVPDDGD